MMSYNKTYYKVNQLSSRLTQHPYYQKGDIQNKKDKKDQQFRPTYIHVL